MMAIMYMPADAFTQQNSVVSGKVISTTDGAGIPYATVALLDQNNRVIDGAATDLDGNYSIEVPSDGKLQFSFIGHTTQIIDVGGRRNIDIRLEESLQTLEEVRITAIAKKGPVNTGYGLVEQRDITGSVSSLNVDRMTQAQSTLWNRCSRVKSPVCRSSPILATRDQV